MRKLLSHLIFAGAAVIISSSIGDGSGVSLQDCSPCTPVKDPSYGNFSGHYRVCFSSNISSDQASAMMDGYQYWANQLGTFTLSWIIYDSRQPDCDQWVDTGPLDVAAVAHPTYDGRGDAGWTVNEENLGHHGDAWFWVGGHEAGHLLGFLGENYDPYCFQKTMMYGTVYFPTNGRTTTTLCGDQLIRRDADNDGYSPDDSGGYYFEELECDNNASRNPGRPPNCDTTNVDENCNLIEDMTECGTPILIDVAGNGFRLTDARSGVPFDLDGDGIAQQLSWTFAGSDDAWLALDRNGNGTIDNGAELFGNFTPQPPSATPNGFAALAVFDQNGDGWIDSTDGVYAQLHLWADSNHDGISQPSERHSLAQAGLLRISLDVRESQRRDRYGNGYRYRAKVVTAHPGEAGRYAYDVFLQVIPPGQNQSVAPLPWGRR